MRVIEFHAQWFRVDFYCRHYPVIIRGKENSRADEGIGERREEFQGRCERSEGRDKQGKGRLGRHGQGEEITSYVR